MEGWSEWKHLTPFPLTIDFLFQEFADALRQYSPQHEGVGSAEGAAKELEKVKADLEQRRREKEQQLKKEQQGWCWHCAYLLCFVSFLYSTHPSFLSIQLSFDKEADRLSYPYSCLICDCRHRINQTEMYWVLYTVQWVYQIYQVLMSLSTVHAPAVICWKLTRLIGVRPI